MIKCLITSSFLITSPADQDPVLYRIMLILFNWYKGPCRSGSNVIACWFGSFGITSPTDQDPVLHNIMLIRFLFYKCSCRQDLICIASCWPSSIGVKASADQDPVFYKIKLIRFSWYKICCSVTVLQHHVDPVSVPTFFLLIRAQCYISQCWSGSTG